mmetsp:Transcript_20989/g.83692  ORF Transcript_20989/g.83692 Transcript_20989/m.83692 type:complete len:239 (-) Transcript_20989:251-967(-)
MSDAVPVEDACSFFVNPYTAVGILDTARARGATAFVHTAAASQLGQMLVKLLVALRRSGDALGGLTVIHVVRTAAQADILRTLGADRVVTVADAETDRAGIAALRDAIDATRATVAFDAVAGAMTGLLVALLPARSTTFVYGRLAGDIRGVAPIDLIYRQKALTAFYLKQWLVGDGPLASARRMMLATGHVRAGLEQRADGWCRSTFVDCRMTDMLDAFYDMKDASGFTDKKLRVRFD